MVRKPRESRLTGLNDLALTQFEPKSASDVFEVFKTGFRARKFSAGLLVAFIDMFLHLETSTMGFQGWDDFVKRFPPLDTNRRGAANTLTIEQRGVQLTLRRFYDPVETYFRAELHRMDYPNCAPHATQAWGEPKYRSWLNVLVRSNEQELLSLRQHVVDFIMETLPDHSAFDSQKSPEPPLFRMALSEFDLGAQPGERSGAPFQGILFGFLRADNPHLQVTAGKVRSGGARHGAVGDVDCWNGAQLAITAEAKFFRMTEEDVIREISDFAERVRQKAAIGLVVAKSFENSAVDAIAAMGLIALSLEDILHHVRLWEPQKQALAINYTVYAFLRIEMSAPLVERFQAFIVEAAARYGRPPPPIEE